MYYSYDNNEDYDYGYDNFIFYDNLGLAYDII